MASHFLTGTGGQRDINGPLIESSFTLCNPHRSPSCPLTMYISRQVKDHRLLTDQKHVYLNRNRHGRSSDFPPASPLATVTTTAESSHRRGTTTFQSTGWTPRSLAPRQLRRRTRQRPRRGRVWPRCWWRQQQLVRVSVMAVRVIRDSLANGDAFMDDEYATACMIITVMESCTPRLKYCHPKVLLPKYCATRSTPSASGSRPRASSR